jgi:hypothetical protein
MGCLGLETPRTKREMSPKPTGMWRLRTLQSPDVTVDARILIRTSLSLGVGLRPPSIEEHRAAHIFHTQLLSYVALQGCFDLLNVVGLVLYLIQEETRRPQAPEPLDFPWIEYIMQCLGLLQVLLKIT